MSDKIFVPKTIPTGISVAAGNSEASHGVYDHLHFDIQTVDDSILATVDRFVATTGGKLTWQNFKRIGFAEVMEQFSRSGQPINERLANILSDQSLFGAPTAHLTAKFGGISTGEKYQEFLDLYSRGVEMVQSLSSSGYIEGERVTFRAEMPGGILRPERSPTVCPVRNIQKVTLASVGRKFRTTEIHISFDRLHLVHPDLLTDLFSQGFYTAFRWDEVTRDYAVIATIQGFELEINLFMVDMYRWLKHEALEGGIGCPVVVKKEDITRFCVFGNEPKLQLVVRPENLL